MAALDLGSSVTRCVIAEKQEEYFNILGYSAIDSEGLKKGNIVDVKSVSKNINEAIEKAQEMANCQVNLVNVNVSGNYITSFKSTGKADIREQEVLESHVTEAITTAQSINVPETHNIVHAIAQNFKVDGQAEIKQPVGMSGSKIEVDLHLVTASKMTINNTIKALEISNFMPHHLVNNALAGYLVSTCAKERELGSIYIDIGQGTTDILVTENNQIKYISSLPVGAGLVTQDIAVGLRVSIADAEKIKIQYGSLVQKPQNYRTSINWQDKDGNKIKISNDLLHEIISARYEEILNLVKRKIDKNLDNYTLQGSVIIAGNATKIPGFEWFAERTYKIPTQIAKANNFIGSKEVLEEPGFMTSLGLIMGQYFPEMIGESKKTADTRSEVFSVIRKWINNTFR